MNGAESLMQTFVDSGIDTCFTNPGTSEMHCVAALDRIAGVRGILGLFEGCVTGMADGYGRMAGKPAFTLLHLGPGLSNASANIHNAKRAGTPMINVVGDHATYHLEYDAPLASDIAGLAKPVSHWYHSTKDANSLAGDGARAVAAAMTYPGQIATLTVPANCAWDEASGPAKPVAPPATPRADSAAITAAAKMLKNGKKTVLLMRGPVLLKRGTNAAGRIAAVSDARLVCDTFISRIERGAGCVKIEKMPYFAEDMVEFLKGTEQLILVGTKPPVSFFAYPGKPGWLTPEGCETLVLTTAAQDGVHALEALASELNAPVHPVHVQQLSRPALPNGGPFNSHTIGAALGALMPENAIVSDEAATSGFACYAPTAGITPVDWLSLTGGSIGQGIPLAAGAAVACPDRKVVCLSGDGGGMYTLQALWTMAREKLDIVTVIFSNRKYLILQVELARVGAGTNPGRKALDLLDLSNPDLNWVQLANGMGVSASRATTQDEFNKQFKDACATKGPHLIEAVI
ncbi:MAG TPA: acetolactate synthase large subunit [Alphaproteobacteria bacterium]|nr:acetolactate synthase large subunit [Alphaproteobacteria bacterium]